ncbi:permease [Anaerobranca gottschalkii]|uniref:Predicted permease n=1 Tax=Anaerobranca gottschalkii DSM 13577 TaxID=1120990 RepID=A0A1H9YPP4_9FIRM|nr:permease [Anaerobranca gottschalkii]SES71108.1 Predicted permease [Anaerobranca gottschalkii DSM 13577]
MMKKGNRYTIIYISLLLLAVLAIYNITFAKKAIDLSINSFKQLLLVLPPIFIILGLLDVWVPKETMVKFMGKEAGFLGIALAFFLGSAAAGPLYGAFPIAAMLLKKGVSFRNVAIFIGAWSTTKIPMLMFEFSAMGLSFTLTRLLVNIPIILIIAFVLEKSITPAEEEEIQLKIKEM